MYLRALTLRHVRLFEEDRLSFVREDGALRMFTVVLAENGHAKTTLLQSIALAAAGVGGANKLVNNAASFFDRRWMPSQADIQQGTDECQIDSTFAFSETTHEQRSYPGFDERPPEPRWIHSNLIIPHEWRQFGGVSVYEGPQPPRGASGHRYPLETARATDLPHWFVVGYGTGRALPSPDFTKDPGNRSIERLASLFRPEPMLATGFVDVLARQHGQQLAREYARTLQDVLVGTLSTPGILPRDGAVRVANLELRGQGGARASSDLLEAERVIVKFGDDEEVRVPTMWLSAGYQSTIAWVADLLGQVALETGMMSPPETLEGLVLIDEIDQHLHPRWQSMLVPALKRTFPRLQFVVTTHSPMILPNLEPGEVLQLRADDRGSVRGERLDEDPRLLTAAQLYREFFGLEGTRSLVGDRYRRYALLAGVSERSRTEQREVEQLYAQLQRDGVSVAPPLDAEVDSNGATEVST